MATATEFVDHAAKITQVTYSTLAGYHRNFKETGAWKSARGPNIPQLSTREVVLFILAILTDPKAKDAAATPEMVATLVEQAFAAGAKTDPKVSSAAVDEAEKYLANALELAITIT